MKKGLLFSLAAVTIAAVGLLSWSCDCDDNGDGIIVAVTAAQETIGARDTVAVTAVVTSGGAAQAGKAVSFEVTTRPAGSSAAVDPETGTTDANGEATVTLTAGSVGGTVVVKATVEGSSGEDTVEVEGVCIEVLYDETVFRMDLLHIDGNTTNNQMGVFAPLLNGLFDELIETGDLNMLAASIGLETIEGTQDFTGVLFNGLCGAPAGPATSACTGTETDFFIDPNSYDEDGVISPHFVGTMVDGVFSSNIDDMCFGMEAEGINIELCMVDVIFEGTVDEAVTTFEGTISAVLVEETLVNGLNALAESLGLCETVPLLDCSLIREGLDMLGVPGMGDPTVDIDGDGIKACNEMPVLEWHWCPDADPVCCGVAPFTAERLDSCECEDEGCIGATGCDDYPGGEEMYQGTVDGFTARLVFHGTLVTIHPLPE
ncbi:MAG: hypothetical protein JSU92_12085 [Deltaproteobacteria bacterium]|nr:MAG: hypothetical protein JSU92_12085 [Deltaproteobacteria bacterium]